MLLAAIKNQVMSAGLNRYVPFSTVGQMGATPYLFRSGFNAGIAFAEDVRPKDYPRDLLKQGIAEGKRIRSTSSATSIRWSRSRTSPRGWCVMQYHRPQEQDGMVMAFRRHQSPYVVARAGSARSTPRRITRSPLPHLRAREAYQMKGPAAAASAGDQRVPRLAPRRIPGPGRSGDDGSMTNVEDTPGGRGKSSNQVPGPFAQSLPGRSDRVLENLVVVAP